MVLATIKITWLLTIFYLSDFDQQNKVYTASVVELGVFWDLFRLESIQT